MRYFSLTMLNIDVKFFEGADSCLLEFQVDHLPADVRGFFLERDVASIVVTVSEFALPVIARYADQLTVEATLDKEVVAPILEMMPVVDREFGRAHNRLHFPRAMFDEPLPQADSHTLQMCIAQCDVLMQRNEQRRGITAVVRSKLFRESGRFPTLPEMAAELDVHPRTLRRQLAEEGTSFRALLNEARSRWRWTCCATSASRWIRCQSGWATPTLRRSATRSGGGTASRRARIRAPASHSLLVPDLPRDSDVPM
jgi:AraC-like DNA-binding protein